MRNIANQLLIQQFKGQSVDISRRLLQLVIQFIKRVSRAAKALGVTAEAEIGVKGFDDEVGEVFKVEGGEVLSLILVAHAAEGVVEFSKLVEAFRLGQEVFAGDLPGKGRLLALEEGDYGFDGGQVFFA